MSLEELTHIIQLAVAPVFLLMGVGGFLNVMAGRLGRIIDRSRELEHRNQDLVDPMLLETSGQELNALRKRIRLNSWSIGFCTFSGLLVCLLIMTLFVGSYWEVSIGGGVVALFVLAMMSLVMALVLFIQETLLATRSLREWGKKYKR